MLVTGPFENRNFRVKWDGKYVSGISKVTGLQWSTQVVLERDGGSPIEQSGPGRSTLAQLGLERGVTTDPTFENWAQAVMGTSVKLVGVLKDLVIEIYDPAGALAVAYNVYRCWPASYEALSVLDAEGSAYVVERLVLEYSSFQRDQSIPAPGV
ncbi:phage tail protein [Granulicella arctica]|uniref:phage tail protein n=1 Tax=Granulicella arctica TaxID=940613 RepID=UPI0021E0C80C|nr:phage tail protein [Granulicella arctica]